jgi:Rrf2 family protein
MSLQVQFLSKTSRYALAATTVLATLPPGERLASADLADLTGVPRAFLGKVLTQLARAGIVDGIKGHGGGYRLAREPEAIVLSEVIAAIRDDEGAFTPCALGAVACDKSNPCAVHDRWLAIRESLAEMLATVTVAEASEPVQRRLASRSSAASGSRG